MDIHRKLTQREEWGGELYYCIDELLRWPETFEKKTKRIDELIKLGADLNSFIGFDGDTILMRAILLENVDLVKRLLKEGADPNSVKEGIKSTALYQAVTTHSNNTETYIEIVKVLIEFKADVNLPGYNGNFPLLDALNSRVFRMLVEAGADLFNKKKGSHTAIARASYDLESLKLVLNKLTQIGTEEKKEVKKWLYLNKALQKAGKAYLKKDVRDLVSIIIFKSVVPTTWSIRLILAGLRDELRAQRYMQGNGFKTDSKIIELLENHNNEEFLEKLAVEKFNKLLLSKAKQKEEKQKDEKPFYYCWSCLKVSEELLKKCSRCHFALYCNRDCQKKHYPVHKHHCSRVI